MLVATGVSLLVAPLQQTELGSIGWAHTHTHTHTCYLDISIYFCIYSSMGGEIDTLIHRQTDRQMISRERNIKN